MTEAEALDLLSLDDPASALRIADWYAEHGDMDACKRWRDESERISLYLTLKDVLPGSRINHTS